jgi:hypothetical protein
MIAIIEELAVGIAISLAVRAVSSVAEFLFAPEKTGKLERPQTCIRCGAVTADVRPHQDEPTKALAE